MYQLPSDELRFLALAVPDSERQLLQLGPRTPERRVGALEWVGEQVVSVSLPHCAG